MSKLPKNNGLRLFNKCAKQVKKEFEKQGRPEKWNEIQKWTSANLYPKFKGQSVNKVLVKDIVAEIKSLTLKKTPQKKSPCFSPFAVNEADFIFSDWWEIANTVEGLPTNVQIRVNGSDQFGSTRIDQRINISPEVDIMPIVEKIREYADNKSGFYFQGIIKVVPNKKDDGSNCSYFIDFVLTLPDGTMVVVEQEAVTKSVPSEEDTERVQRQKEKERKKRVSKREKMKKAKTQKRPTTSKKEKKEKKQAKSKEPRPDIVRALELLKEDFKDGIFTKEEYKKEREKLIAKFEKGGKLSS